MQRESLASARTLAPRPARALGVELAQVTPGHARCRALSDERDDHDPRASGPPRAASPRRARATSRRRLRARRCEGQAAHVDRRQPVRDDGLRPAAPPRRPRAAGRFEVDAVDTEARGHATELCREAAHEGYDVVVAFGGDGTVNEAVNGLMGSPAGFSATPLTCLPGGSANVFDKMLGIPGELVDATEHLLALADDWRPRRVDLGLVSAANAEGVLAESRCFTFASGLGLDASVSSESTPNPRLKARFGAYFFTWVALRTFPRHYLVRPPRMDVLAGDERSGRHGDRSERLPVHLLPQPPDRDRRWHNARLGHALRLRAAPRHAPVDALARLARVLRSRARQPPPSGHRPVRADRADRALNRRAPAAAAGRRRLPRRGRQARYSILPGA